jgi:YggT family protein
MLSLICLLLQLFTLVLFARMLLSWFPMPPDGVLATINRALFTVTEPVLAPVRSLIPPVRTGAMAFDLSPIIVFVGIILISGWIC